MAVDYVALIPARGGSRGVPRKNLARVGGSSLLERAIRSALDCDRIGACFVSSEDDEILEVARREGATPHRRSIDASSDQARASEVVDDFVNRVQLDFATTRIVYLQPTSPFRTASHVRQAIQLMEESGASSLVSVERSPFLPEKMLRMGEDSLLRLADDSGDPGANRQLFEKSFYPNGAIYIFDLEAFFRSGDVPVSESIGFVMTKLESLDIDDPDDLQIARGLVDVADA